MPAAAPETVPALRREILARKDDLIALADRAARLDPAAARSLLRARALVFEAWTILCGPPEEEDDH